MKKYARIYLGKIAELFETDGNMVEMFHPDVVWADVTDIEPPPGVEWSATLSGDGWEFAEPVAPVPTQEELRRVALAQRDAYLSIADETTAGMADAYLIGLLDENDLAIFKAFAAYKLKLNKIDKQPGYPEVIEWPEAPVRS